jgi:hypothetical protein
VFLVYDNSSVARAFALSLSSCLGIRDLLQMISMCLSTLLYIYIILRSLVWAILEEYLLLSLHGTSSPMVGACPVEVESATSPRCPNISLQTVWETGGMSNRSEVARMRSVKYPSPRLPRPDVEETRRQLQLGVAHRNASMHSQENRQ